MDPAVDERIRQQYLGQLRKVIKQHGWAVQGVIEDNCAYTVGLTERRWPEFHLTVDDEFLAAEDPKADSADILNSATKLLNNLVQFYIENGFKPKDKDKVRVVDNTGQRYDCHITTMLTSGPLNAARALYGTKLRALAVHLQRVPDDVEGNDDTGPDIDRTIDQVMADDEPHVQTFPTTQAMTAWITRLTTKAINGGARIGYTLDESHAFAILYRLDREPSKQAIADVAVQAVKSQHALGIGPPSSS